MQTTLGSSLVAGATASNATEQSMQIKVVRCFLYQGQQRAVGSLLDVPAPFGRELVAMGKAEKADEPAETTPIAEADATEQQPDPDGGNEFTRPRRGRPPKPKE